MRKPKLYLFLFLFAVLLNGACTISRTKVPVPKVYENFYVYNTGYLDRLVLNEVNHQFYYFKGGLETPSLVGSWKVMEDTLCLSPGFLYMYGANDSLLMKCVDENFDDFKYYFYENRFLIRGKKNEYLVDITDYSTVYNDYDLHVLNIPIIENYFLVQPKYYRKTHKLLDKISIDEFNKKFLNVDSK